MNEEEKLNAIKDKAEDAVEAAKETAEEAVEAVEEKAQEAFEAAEEKIEEAVEAAKDKADDAVEAAKETAQEASEAVEENIEEAVEAAKETAGEAVEAVENAAETAGEAVENAVDAAEQEAAQTIIDQAPQKKGKSGIAAAAAVIIVAIAVIAGMIFLNSRNGGSKYDGDYLDIDGTTAGSIADQQGMEYEEFLEMYGLPEDLPKETNGNATENLIPLGKYVEFMGTDLATVRERMGWDETFTEEMTIGEARDKTTLAKLVGEESLDQFKTTYGLDESVTGETLFGDVRHQLEVKQKEMLDEQKKAEEDAAKATEEAEKTDDADAAVEGQEEKAEDSADKAEDSKDKAEDNKQ